MRIGVTCRFRKEDYGGGIYYINNANVRMFNDNNVTLVPITSINDSNFILEVCDGLLVPGGCDVDPSNYKQELNGSIDCIPFIDELDLFYIDLFYKAKKPILGICRGIQIINVYFNGTLHQDIKNHHSLFHDVRLEKDSFVYNIYHQEILSVNSYHHQVIDKLGDGLKPIAYSNEGYIEAVEGDNIYAIQWHPELYDGNNFIKYFIDNVFK